MSLLYRSSQNSSSSMILESQSSKLLSCSSAATASAAAGSKMQRRIVEEEESAELLLESPRGSIDRDDELDCATRMDKRRRMIFKPIAQNPSSSVWSPPSVLSCSENHYFPPGETSSRMGTTTATAPSPYTSVASLLSSDSITPEDVDADQVVVVTQLPMMMSSNHNLSRPGSPSTPLMSSSSAPPSPSSYSPSPAPSRSVSPTASPSRAAEDRQVMALLSPLLAAIEAEPYWRELKKRAREESDNNSIIMSNNTEEEEPELPADDDSSAEVSEEFDADAASEEEEDEYLNNNEEDDEDYEGMSPCTPSRKRKNDDQGSPSPTASSSRSQTEALKAIYDEKLEQIYQRLLHNIRPTIGKREPTDLWQYAGLWRICKEVDSRQTGLFKSGTPVKSERRFPSRQNIYHWFVKMKIKKTHLFETFPRDTETLEYLKKRLVIDSMAYKHQADKLSRSH